jgi:hypothetical protein
LKKVAKISPTKTQKIPDSFIYFDTESWVKTDIENIDIEKVKNGSKVFKKHKHYLTCACFNNTFKVYMRESLDSFWGDVNSYAKGNKETWVFAHNAGYDCLVSGLVPRLVGLGMYVETFSPKNPFFMILTNKRCDKKCESCVYSESKKRVRCRFPEYKIRIVDSLNYYNTSLLKLGEKFGMSKGECDYENTTDLGAVEYCLNDVDILKTAMEEFISLIKRDNMGSLKMTLAGQSFAAFRARFLNCDIFLHRDLWELILERNGYSGGRNECFYLGKVPEPIYYLDVNSMYPYVMMKYPYPVKKLGSRKLYEDVKYRKEGMEEFFNSWKILDGNLFLADVLVKTNESVFPLKGERLEFPVGEFRTQLTTEEIRYGLEHNLIVHIYSYVWYEASFYFKDYIDYYYNERLKSGDKGDEILKYLYKIFQNALYGKFGQKNEHWEKIGNCDINEVYEMIVDIEGKPTLTKCFGGGVFKKTKMPTGENESLYSFPAVSAHVTANARMLLWEYMKIAQKVYYCDTDSLMTNKEGYDRLMNAGFIDKNKLGWLKLEKQTDDLLLWGCKDYEIDGKRTLKGVSMVKCKCKGKDDNCPECKGMGKVYNEIDNNTFAVVQWGSFNSSIRKGDLINFENKVVLKTLKREYKKGKVLESGEVVANEKR